MTQAALTMIAQSGESSPCRAPAMRAIVVDGTPAPSEITCSVAGIPLNRGGAPAETHLCFSAPLLPAWAKSRWVGSWTGFLRRYV